MSTYTQILYHVVFTTKNRRRRLSKDKREPLFRYIWGVVKNNQCHLYRINAVEDHVHLLTSLHPTVPLADLVKDIKISSALWIKEKGVFLGFDHWQDGYGAFTASYDRKDELIAYIKGQEDHHKRVSFQDELKKLLKDAGVKFDEKYLA